MNKHDTIYSPSPFGVNRQSTQLCLGSKSWSLWRTAILDSFGTSPGHGITTGSRYARFFVCLCQVVLCANSIASDVCCVEATATTKNLFSCGAGVVEPPDILRSRHWHVSVFSLCCFFPNTNQVYIEHVRSKVIPDPCPLAEAKKVSNNFK